MPGAHTSTPPPATEGTTNFYDEYEFEPTPTNAKRIPKCLPEYALLTFSLLICIVFGISALATEQVKYKDRDVLQITVQTTHVKGCLLSECDRYKLTEVFCEKFTKVVATFTGFSIMSILLAVIALIISIINVCGRDVFVKSSAAYIAVICCIFTFIAMINASTVLTAKHCKGTSLKELGFKYGAAFPLSLTSFLVQALVLIFFFVRQCCCRR